jgi:hypothetical protein
MKLLFEGPCTWAIEADGRPLAWHSSAGSENGRNRSGTSDRPFLEGIPFFLPLFSRSAVRVGNLRAKGMKLGILTNSSVRMQERKIHQLGLAELFDEVVISEREGARKPDPQIFDGRLRNSA